MPSETTEAMTGRAALPGRTATAETWRDIAVSMFIASLAADNLLDPPLKLYIPENKATFPLSLRIDTPVATLDSQPCA
jgi:hypothetical protein